MTAPTEASATIAAPAPTIDGAPPPRGFVGRLVDRVVDRANPIVVRYVRQQLRSRAFIVVFSTMIALAALASLGVGASAGRGREGQAAIELLSVLAVLWTFAAWVFEPLNAYRAVSGERDDQTWDLIRLTGIRPGKLLRGMLLASVIQSAIYASAFAPFLVMAYLLRGIDIITVVFLLGFIPLCGTCASAGAIFLGTLGINRPARIALWSLCAVVCGLIWFVSVMGFVNLEGAAFFFMFSGVAAEAAPALAIFGSFAVIWVVTMLILGASLVERDAANRSTAPRILVLCLGLAWCLWAMLAELPVGFGESILEGLAYGGTALALLTFVMGIFAVAEPYAITPRQARGIARMRWWQLPSVFGPGAARGRRAYILFSALAVGLSVIGAWEANHSDPVQALHVTVAVVAWGAIFLAVGDALGRYRFKVKTALGRRLVTLAVLGVMTFLAMTALQLDPHVETPLPWLSPIPGMWIAGDQSAYDWDSVLALAIPGVLALAALAIQAVQADRAHARTLAKTGGA